MIYSVVLIYFSVITLCCTVYILTEICCEDTEVAEGTVLWVAVVDFVINFLFRERWEIS